VNLTNRIRVGIVGGNSRRGWARDAHVPALKHLDHLFEIVAVSARTQELADEAAADFGAPVAFGNTFDLVSSPDVDIVSVTVKVPEHRDIVLAALAANKHVYCEWPLGRNIAEAEEMAAAVSRNTHVMIGLQALSAPVVSQALELVRSGTLGSLQLMRVYSPTVGWGKQVPPFYSYLQDKQNGATLEAIAGGHTLAIMEALAGRILEVDSRKSTLNPLVQIEGTTQKVKRTCADHMSVTALHEGGCVSMLEVVGGVSNEEFMLVLQGERGRIRIRGKFAGGFQAANLTLETEVEVAKMIDAGILQGPPKNVAMAYSRFARDIRAGASTVPDFNDAVRLTRLLETIDRASSNGRERTRE
jgi:predicted dehydrogenase